MKKFALFLAALAVGAVVFAQVTGEDPVLEPTDPNIKPVEGARFVAATLHLKSTEK